MLAENIQKTKNVREALALAELLTETPGAAIGEIVGETGTGKTQAASTVLAEYPGVRIACHEGMTRYQLIARIVTGLGIQGPSTRWLELLADHQSREGGRSILIVDEANKLKWQALEVLRYLADECGYAVLLVGTEIYEHQFTSARTRPLLLQLGRRIGAKRVRMGHLDRADTARYLLQPRFGEVEKEIATRFWTGCRRGNWGEAVELASEALRLARLNNAQTLTLPVLDAALAWFANRRDAVMSGGHGD
jgi:DNA transposition AAA+ family ATPase